MNKNRLFIGGVLALFSAQTLAAGDILVRPKVSLGVQSYELDITIPAIAPNPAISFKQKSTYAILGAGVSLAMDEFFADATIATSLGAEYTDAGVDEDFKRTDYAITAGMKIPSDLNLSVFGGFKGGSSTFDITGLGELTFDTTGFFAGVGMAFPAGPGVISTNVSVAFMQADEEVTGGGGAAEADATGFGLGAAYSMYLTDTMGLSVKGAFHNYSFDDFKIGATVVAADPEETVFSADASIFMNF